MNEKQTALHEHRRRNAVSYAILAALLYGLSAPASKVFLDVIPPTLMAALLYLGAGLGMLAVHVGTQLKTKEVKEAKMTKKEMPFVVGMILLDIAAPIFLMVGLTLTTSANASLLNNFEIVATSLIALTLFKETIGKRMWGAIGLITLSSVLLSLGEANSLSFSLGSVFVLLACICWGLENNCTRMLSMKNPLQIVIVKGFGSGFGTLLIALFLNETTTNLLFVFGALLLGFFAFGLSIYFYIMAQRDLGAARTSAYYASAPFIGVVLSWVFLQEPITPLFMIALCIMLVGTYFAISEEHGHLHVHAMETHDHKHSHEDGYHFHPHDEEVVGEHTHDYLEHDHDHLPDIHHSHSH